MSVAWVGVGVAAVGTLASMDAASEAGDRQDRAIAGQEGAAAGQLALAKKQDARAEEQWLRYKNTYAPAEDQMLDEAQGMGSIANQNKAAGEAAAAVSSSFSNARDRLNKNPGMDPSSQQYQQEAGKLALGEAATSAAAQTGARGATKDRAAAALTNAVSLGKGLPASAAALGGSAGAIMGSAGGIYGSASNNATQQGDNAVSGIGSLAKGVSGVLGNKQVQNWANGIGSANTSQASSFGSGGQMDDLASYGVF